LGPRWLDAAAPYQHRRVFRRLGFGSQKPTQKHENPTSGVAGQPEIDLRRPRDSSLQVDFGRLATLQVGFLFGGHVAQIVGNVKKTNIKKDLRRRRSKKKCSAAVSKNAADCFNNVVHF